MGTQQFCLKWNNHQTNMLVVFEQLLSNEALVDVTLACEGHSLKAHRMVLSACSPFFQALFVENPCQHPIVIMKDMRYVDLKAVVEFMYKGEVNVSQDQLSALLKTAEALKVKGLADVTGDAKHGLASVDGGDARTISTARTESPPVSKRKRGRRRSPSNSNKSDSEDQGAPPPTRIKTPESPEVIEDGSLSSDHIMATGVPIESPVARSTSGVVLTAVSSSSAVPSNKVGGGLPVSTLTANSSMSSQHTQDSVGDDTGADGDDADFEVEPSNLMEQSMTTENVPVFADVTPSSQATTLALESPQSLHTGPRSDSSAVPVSLPSDISSHTDIKPSPSSLIPLLEEQAISPAVPPQPVVSMPGDSSSSAMLMAFTDMSGVPAIAGPSSFHPDQQQSTPSHGYPLLDREFGPFKCGHCPRRFRHQGHLLRHVKTAHANEAERPFPFLCEQCGLKFDRREALFEHLATHAGGASYKCRHCFAVFFTEFQLMVHRQKCHLVKCPPYPRSSSEGPPGDWRSAAVKEEPYRCERCPIAFDQPSLLMKHRLTHHTNMELFQCHLCPKDFIRKGHLARHLRTHTPPPP